MQITNMHHIQKYILKTLSYTKWARFRDMRPKSVDSNLYNYHLKILINGGMVEKVNGKGYRLSPDGLRFADHVSIENFEPRWQPKILTKAVSINDKNEILLWPKYKQPFIGLWSLPSGKMHYDDESATQAVLREISYISDKIPRKITSSGVVEYRVFINRQLVTHTIAHIFTVNIDYNNRGSSRYMPLDRLGELELSPGTKECIDDVLGHDEFFFTHHDIDY